MALAGIFLYSLDPEIVFATVFMNYTHVYSIRNLLSSSNLSMQNLRNVLNSICHFFLFSLSLSFVHYFDYISLGKTKFWISQMPTNFGLHLIYILYPESMLPVETVLISFNS